MEIFNSMTRRKEEFVPIEPGKLKMYACGPTVYNLIHVGNARPIILFDVFRRYMEYRGYEVTFVQNFTDVDDKIIKRANEEGLTSQQVAEKYIEEYFTDAKGLGVRPATIHPEATETMDEIIDLVQTLVEKGYAYPVPSGDVYYRTLKFKGYGKLSHQPIEDLLSGARIDVNDEKENPLDFALWKARKEEQARRRKIANDLKKCEEAIARLEAEGEALDEEISLPENSTDPDKLRDLTSKREAVDEKLAELYEQWESLSELAEE